MKTTKILLVTLLCCMSPALAKAEETTVSQESTPDIQNRIAKWKQLREQNPAEFDRLVAQRKNQIKNKVSEFKAKNPEKFESMKKQFLANRGQRLGRLQQENPQKFHEVVQKRMNQFQDWKQKNPEKSQRFLKDHPHFQEKIEKRREMKQNRSEERQQFKKMRQEDPEKFKQMRQERKEKLVRQYRQDLEQNKNFAEKHIQEREGKGLKERQRIVENGKQELRRGSLPNGRLAAPGGKGASKAWQNQRGPGGNTRRRSR